MNAAISGRDQSSVSKLETCSDMLLSTLAEYLLAAGADAATVKGPDYSFGLAHVDASEREIQDA
ncbi:hypothetical protein ABH920_006367 [Catenulispora sp. EB89]|uniref:hypothetical protein n=1 Tax=Catenulispora sp. EB89 TaxID=3156257 RepID=UPI003515D381